MRLILVIIILSTFLININASTIQVSGEVHGTWDVDTVQVIDNLLIPNNLSLVIDPGVRIIMDGHFLFTVDGQILALGHENDSIIFTVTDTTGFSILQSSEGAWNGFWFNQLSPNNDTSMFDFCKFEFGKAIGADSSYWYGGAICIRQFDKIKISNCSFTNNIAYKNGGAIYVLNSSPIIVNCKFSNNSCGLDSLYGYGGAVCLEYSNSTIFRNYFTQNRSTGVGGGLSFEYSKPTIESNYFYENFSAIGGGMVCLRSGKNKSIVNNLYENNGALFFGGGLAFLETSVLLVNNTIVNNFAGQGGGLYFNFESTPDFRNCIIWGNTAGANDGSQVYIWDIYSAPEFNCCNIQYGLEGFSGAGGSGVGFIGVYEDCLETDPMFVFSGIFPFQLNDNSPCINNGTLDTTGLFLPETDLSEQERFIGNRIDIGAYESQLETSTFSHLSKKKEVRIYPNPITNQSVISLELTERQEINFSVFDINGKLVWNNTKSDYDKGLNLFPLNNLKLKPGIYLLKITSTDKGTKLINRRLMIL